MLESFNELENLFKTKQIRMQNQYLDKIINNFSIVYLTIDNYIKEINQRKDNSQIITINYNEIHQDVKNNHFFFCLNNTIFQIFYYK